MGDVIEGPWKPPRQVSTADVWGAWADYLDKSIDSGARIDAANLEPLLRPFRHFERQYRSGRNPIWINPPSRRP